MTNEEALKVLENEKECIQRQVNGNCDNKRDCANCDLRLEDKEIILAYNTAISAVEKQIPKKVSVIEMPCENIYFCPNCNNAIPHEKYCSKCGQDLDWSDSE